MSTWWGSWMRVMQERAKCRSLWHWRESLWAKMSPIAWSSRLWKRPFSSKSYQAHISWNFTTAFSRRTSMATGTSTYWWNMQRRGTFLRTWSWRPSRTSASSKRKRSGASVELLCRDLRCFIHGTLFTKTLNRKTSSWWKTCLLRYLFST